MGTTEIIALVSTVFAVILIMQFYDRGKKALSIFPDIRNETVVYRDRTATGYSTRSWHTRVGGASRSLDIVVTGSELWLKSFVLLAGVARQHDLIHRIDLSNIMKIKQEGSAVTIDFRNDKGDRKQVVINTRNPPDFIRAIKGI